MLGSPRKSHWCHRESCETSDPIGHRTEILTDKINVFESTENTQQVAREKGWDRLAHGGWGSRNREGPRCPSPVRQCLHAASYMLPHQPFSLMCGCWDQSQGQSKSVPGGGKYLRPTYTLALWDRCGNEYPWPERSLASQPKEQLRIVPVFCEQGAHGDRMGVTNRRLN